jgi:[ribosomal protein S5]-alanine N-acetyltransferase
MPEFMANELLANLPWLYTERLILRPMNEADAAIVVRWRNSQHVAKFSKSKSKLTIEGHLAWFRKTRKTRIDYVMLKKNDLIPIGSFSFKEYIDLNGKNPCAELGKYIGEVSALGKGYSKEGQKLWIEFGFNYCHFNTIVALTRSDNFPSFRVNEGMGFMVERSFIEDDVQWLFMVLKRISWFSTKTLSERGAHHGFK